jgi:hypothetical protein
MFRHAAYVRRKSGGVKGHELHELSLVWLQSVSIRDIRTILSSVKLAGWI